MISLVIVTIKPGLVILPFLPLLADVVPPAGTATNQYYLLAAISALGAVIIYLHKANERSASAQAAADLARFNSFVAHHEELIKKIDLERESMTQERLKRIEMLMTLVAQNSTAAEKQASASEELRGAIDHLGTLIRERIAPIAAQPSKA